MAVSPIVTVEPRRRKFHKPITLTIPVPKAAQKGMINQYGADRPTLRLLYSLAGGWLPFSSFALCHWPVIFPPLHLATKITLLASGLPLLQSAITFGLKCIIVSDSLPEMLPDDSLCKCFYF